MSKPTRAVKKQITADWLGMFPGLGAYEPMHLLRRVGPLVEGLVLDRTSSNDEYRPAFHVHSLLRVFPAVMLAMSHPLLREATHARVSVSVLRHPTYYVEAATTLKRQSPLALEGSLRLTDVIAAYRRFSERAGLHYDAHSLYEDMAAISAWCGSTTLSHSLVEEGVSKLEAWPENVRRQVGGIDAWRGQMLTTISNRRALIDMAQSQIEALKLGSIPVAELVCDES